LETDSRTKGTGAPFVQNKLRLFGSNERPKLTLYRDHAGECLFRLSCLLQIIIHHLNLHLQLTCTLFQGWCPYCQKTMLLIEEKQIPINIELVPMRSYGELL
jgi:glutathione S-transferase